MAFGQTCIAAAIVSDSRLHLHIVTRPATGETARRVRITCPDHGPLQLSALRSGEAAAFARSHDEGHCDGQHHAVIEWTTDAWEADPHDVD